MTLLPDAELLRRSRTDVQAFGELFDRHASAVHGFIARRLGRQGADDLLSEVFLRAVEARTRVRPHESGSALPWLYGIARNVARAHLRSRAAPVPPVENAYVDWEAVDARVDARAAVTELRAALDTLTETERDVLLLVAWEELSVAGAAEVLGISPTAARSRLHRARARAAAALAATPHPTDSQETSHVTR